MAQAKKNRSNAPVKQTASQNTTKWPWLIAKFPWMLLGLSAVGLMSSLILTLEKFELAKDPGHQLSCSINPLLSCGPIIGSEQASAFGLPNPFLGLFGFPVLICLAAIMLTGALNLKKLPSWFMNTFLVSVFAGFAFCLWLMSQSFWVLGALCIYCMVTWAVVSALALYAPLWVLAVREPKLTGVKLSVYQFFRRNHFGIYLLWVFMVFAAIVLTFRDYFESLI